MPIQTAADSISNSAGSPYGFKNRIINGAMVIDQRNAGASLTANDNVFGVDRFRTETTQSSKLTMQQNAGSVTPPPGFQKYIGLTSSSSYSITSSDRFTLAQWIEGYSVADLDLGTSTAKTFTLSFWARSSLTGTFGGTCIGYDQSSAFRSYTWNYTINQANTWEYKTITIPGDTTTFAYGKTNNYGLFVAFSLGHGSNFTTAPNVWTSGIYYAPTTHTSLVGTNGATLYITGVQLEKGSQATAFDYRPFGIEYNLCARYFFSSYAYGNVPGSNTDINSIYGIGVPNQFFGGMSFPTMMRTFPTVTGYHPNLGTSGTFGAYGDGTTSFNISGTRASDKGFTNFISSSSVTGGAGLRVNITASAEL